MNDDEKYKALIEKSQGLDGAFYVGVKTTGIFCRTSCTARKPKRENVVFYDTIQEAMAAGFRPCKVCRPMEGAGAIPAEYSELLEKIGQNPSLRIKEAELRQKGIDPGTLRRWFQKNYGMSFQGYCRMLRISRAFGAVQEGERILDTALDSGYDSVSGFNAAYKKALGTSPVKSRSKAQNILLYKRFDSPLGPMIAIVSEEGLCLLEFGDRRMLETEFADLERRLQAVILPGNHRWLDQAVSELMEYFEGKRRSFTVPLHTPGTDFQRKVWQQLLCIPYGKKMSYKTMAEELGQPGAVRAVGRANGMNRIAIMIPCHRVIGAGGELTGYGGGLWRKDWLLTHESAGKT